MVFADVVGSTATAEQLDVEDVRLRLLQFHAAVRAALERHGGVVEKFIGDAVVGIFGADQAHEDDALRGVRAALEARDAVAHLREAESWLDLHARFGAATGEALVAVGAARDGPEGVVAGDVMNTAARIQGAAPVDGVLVGADTHRAARQAIGFRRAEAIPAKGKAEPVEVWEALEELERPRLRRPDLPLVGRSSELAALEEVWHDVVATARGRLVTVAGPAGAGKSRLVAELLGRLDAGVLSGRCLAYGEGITYWPLTEALAEAAGARLSDTPDELAARLAQLTASTGATPDEQATVDRALAALVGEAPSTRAELHWGLRRLLELLAAGRPLILLVEDVHWAEETLLELLGSLEGAAAALLVLATARTDETETWAAATGGTVVSLPPLTEQESLALIDELLGVAAAPETRRSLARRAAGNPLFLEETARAISVQGLDEAVDPAELPVPAGLQGLVGARLDRLPASARRLLGAAAVVGTVFWESALASIVSPAAPGELDSLLAEGLVHVRPASSLEGQRELAFHHDLFRDVAYGRLPKGLRAELHVACADWIEDLPAAPELVEIVASHLERSCLILRDVARPPMPPPVARTVEALSTAADRAESREGFSEAERYLTRSLELVDPTDAASDVLRVRRCRLQVALGRLDDAAVDLASVATDDALAARSPLERGRALMWLANIHFKQSRHAEARACLEDAAAIADETGDTGLAARVAYERSALLATFESDLPGAVAELERGRGLAAASGDAVLAVEGRLRLGFHLCALGRFAEADRELRLVVAEAESLGRVREAARARMELGFVLRFRGLPDEAEAMCRLAEEPLTRAGDRYFVAQNLRLLAQLVLARGRSEEAAEHAGAALVAARAVGASIIVIEAQAALVDAFLADGRLDEARTVAAAARVERPEGDPEADLELLCLDASVLAASGELDTACALLDRAVVQADGLDRIIDRVLVRIDLARVLAANGDPHAAAVLEEAGALARSVDAAGLLQLADAAEPQSAQV